jgi:DNA-binding transcriptional LysR family regulator
MFTHLPHLNQVRGFEAAARLGSFKAAGEELNLSPTAISHQISNLEDKLGVLLFERKTRAVILTPEGHQLAEAVYQALQRLSATIEEISSAKSVLRVSTTTSFASMWLVPNLASFQKQYPEIQVEIKTTEELIDINRDRSVDLVIRYGCNKENNEGATKLVTEDFRAYATETYLASHQKLEEATFIETKWKNKSLPLVSWSKWLEAFRPNTSVSNTISFDQEHHAIQAALASQGLVLASSVLAEMAIQQSWLKPLGSSNSIPGLTYYLLIPSHSENLYKCIVFKKWLIGTLGPNA